MKYDVYERPIMTHGGGVVYEIRWNIGDFIANVKFRHTIPDMKATLKPATLEMATTPNELFRRTEEVTVNKAVIVMEKSTRPNIYTPWFLSSRELNDYIDRMIGPVSVHDICYITGVLYRQCIHPLTFPHRVILSKNDKGFYTRIETHPEVTGKSHGCGKLFFPNKSCIKNLCEGPAIVSSIFEKPTYGFMNVKMEQFTMPTKQELDHFLRTVGQIFDLPWSTLECGTSIFGECIRIVDELGCDMIVVKDSAGDVIWADLLSGYLEFDDPDDPGYVTITTRTTLYEYLKEVRTNGMV